MKVSGGGNESGGRDRKRTHCWTTGKDAIRVKRIFNVIKVLQKDEKKNKNGWEKERKKATKSTSLCGAKRMARTNKSHIVDIKDCCMAKEVLKGHTVCDSGMEENFWEGK